MGGREWLNNKLGEMQGRTEQQKERQGEELWRRKDGEEMREGREKRSHEK